MHMVLTRPCDGSNPPRPTFFHPFRHPRILSQIPPYHRQCWHADVKLSGTIYPPANNLSRMLSHVQRRLSTELRTDAAKLDAACRTRWGVSATVFRTAKFLFYIVTLLFSGYLIEVAGVTPFVAMLFAALLITGPEGLEAYLIRQGVIDDPGERED